MEIKDVISTSIDKFIDDTFKSEDIRNFLKRHERRVLLEGNLLREIKKADHVIKDMKTIEELAKDFARTFCKVAIRVKSKEMTRGLSI